MSHTQIQVEAVFWAFSMIVCAIVALFPDGFFRILGMGRTTPSPSALKVVRLLAAFCFFGLIYRLVWLYHR